MAYADCSLSMPCSQLPDRWTARAQPLLGTVVEVALPPGDATAARFAAAFSAIAHVHRTMSPHDAASDLSRIAREAHHRAVVVDPATFAVLELAQALYRASAGAFDVAIAPLLARSGHLPPSAAGHATLDARMDAVHLEHGCRVRADVAVALDLGGIAKGYAVDRAVAALRASGAHAGLVNAGGDLRVFGTCHWQRVRVRHPSGAAALHLFEVRDAAVATSADTFRDDGGGLVDPRARRVRRFPGSITVVAPTCALADALTKVVALRPAESVALLARHRAHAFMLHDGLTQATTTCAASDAHLRLPLAFAA
jgi:FAD:protein FMN transferase